MYVQDGKDHKQGRRRKKNNVEHMLLLFNRAPSQIRWKLPSRRICYESPVNAAHTQSLTTMDKSMNDWSFEDPGTTRCSVRRAKHGRLPPAQKMSTQHAKWTALIKRQFDHGTSFLWLFPTRSFCRAALPSLCPFGSGNGPTICPEATIGNPVGSSP